MSDESAGAGTAGESAESAGAGTAGEGGQQSPDYESAAREKGWRPKEDFEVVPTTWVDAEVWVKNQPLVDKIKFQSKKLKELDRTVHAIASHYKVNIEQAKTKAITELKEQRVDAIQRGDAVQVDQIDQQIEEVRQIAPPVDARPSLAPEIEQFVEDQKTWFHKDQEMTDFAITFNETYLKRNPGDLQKSLDETLKAVKKAYPEKFTNTRRETAPSVEGGGSPPSAAGGNGKYTMGRLTSEQKLVYNQLVTQHKQLTHEQYFKDLDEAGFLSR